jgi:hypothetical protein
MAERMAKGTLYENQVATAVEAELAQGNLGIDPGLATVRRKPKYFSRDRQKDITFDLSIEVFRRGASTPYWVWVWECKNYGHRVPVDDAEEFHEKLQQVGADRTKGTISTPIGFDPGTIEYARSKGIGLCRYVPEGSVVLIMEDSRGVDAADILHALTTSDTTKFRFYGFFYALSSEGQLTTDSSELISTELRDATNS